MNSGAKARKTNQSYIRKRKWWLNCTATIKFEQQKFFVYRKDACTLESPSCGSA